MKAREQREQALQGWVNVKQMTESRRALLEAKRDALKSVIC